MLGTPPKTPDPVARRAQLLEKAFCFDCGYSLRGLTVNRCPECGWQFDPGDAVLMDVCGAQGRFARQTIGPLPSWIRTVVVRSCCAIIWGSALLPGGRNVELLGWLSLLLITVYSLTRRAIRGSLRFSEGLPQLPEPASEHYRWWQILLVALAASAPILFIPLRINLLIERPFLNHLTNNVYAVEPAIFPPSPPRFAGLMIFTSATPEHDGVELDVLGGGVIFWSAPDSGDAKGPRYTPLDARGRPLCYAFR